MSTAGGALYGKMQMSFSSLNGELLEELNVNISRKLKFLVTLIQCSSPEKQKDMGAERDRWGVRHMAVCSLSQVTPSGCSLSPCPLPVYVLTAL